VASGRETGNGKRLLLEKSRKRDAPVKNPGAGKIQKKTGKASKCSSNAEECRIEQSRAEPNQNVPKEKVLQVQGYLAHKKAPNPLGSPEGPRHRPSAGSRRRRFLKSGVPLYIVRAASRSRSTFFFH